MKESDRRVKENSSRIDSYHSHVMSAWNGFPGVLEVHLRARASAPRVQLHQASQMTTWSTWVLNGGILWETGPLCGLSDSLETTS